MVAEVWERDDSESGSDERTNVGTESRVPSDHADGTVDEQDNRTSTCSSDAGGQAEHEDAGEEDDDMARGGVATEQFVLCLLETGKILV